MNLLGLSIFVAVADHGSFSGAAAALGLAKSTVSQRVQDLEAELGVQLLARTSRQVSLTEAGEVLVHRGHEILAAADEAEQLVSQLRHSPVGRLQISAPVSFGRRFIASVLSELLVEHAGLSVKLDLEDRDVDLIGERYDLAIRVGELPASDLTVKKIGSARWFVVGAPAYFERRGRPTHPDELSAHECLRFAYRRVPNVWHFHGGQGRVDVRVDGRMVCNHGDILAETAAAGLGLAWLPDFVVSDMVAAGRLERVLDEFCDAEAPIHLVFPERRHRLLKVRLFSDALEKAIATLESVASPDRA